MLFPTAIILTLNPAFVLKPYLAAKQFFTYFKDSYLDPDEHGITAVIREEITHYKYDIESDQANEEPIVVGAHDLAVHMKYIDNTERVLVFTFGPDSVFVTKH